MCLQLIKHILRLTFELKKGQMLIEGMLELICYFSNNAKPFSESLLHAIQTILFKWSMIYTFIYFRTGRLSL